jgi:CTP synthase
MGHENFLTMGQVYKNIIDRERSMGYNGKTVDAIPEIPNEIIKNIKKAGEGKDVCIIELGGTAGEYQNVFNIETARIMKLTYPKDVIHIHLSYVPVPDHLGEPKTKPTQLSFRLLNSAGIQPDYLIVRSEVEIDQKRKNKLAINCNLLEENIINSPDVDSIYQLPIKFREQNFDQNIINTLNLKSKKDESLEDIEDLVNRIQKDYEEEVTIVIAGKYFATGEYELLDSYAALIEAIEHAVWAEGVNLNLKFVNTENIEKNGSKKYLADADGIIVPIGWGSRGVEGKIDAIKYARENKIPYLGLCYGMQLAAVEYARNVVGMKDANTEEVDPESDHKIIHSIPFDPKYQVIKGEGTSMRLGAYDCVIKKDTLAHKIYSDYDEFKDESNDIISERHRHRFEFNNEYREELEEAGLIISGTSPDDFFVEMIELPKDKHPFFIATQAHPEYKSRPLDPHPIFVEFIKASLKFGRK